MKPTDVKFIHRQTPNGGFYPGDHWYCPIHAISIGYMTREDVDKVSVMAAASYCSIMDEFRYKKARQIIRGRLACKRLLSGTKRKFLTFPAMPKTGEEWKELEKAIFDSFTVDGDNGELNARTD